MEQREYELMAAIEDVHPWFVATRGIIRDAFLEAGVLPQSHVLDVGCGTGGTMKSLAGMCHFTGLDFSPLAADLATKSTGNDVVVANATQMPFENATFDAAVACHVLEHIADHDAAVAEIRRVIKPGGALVALVPCHQFMFNDHDRSLHHVRRYSKKEFLDLMTRNGFVPQKVIWTNSLLYPATAVERLISKIKIPGLVGSKRVAYSDATHSLGFLTPVVALVTETERRLMKRLPLPFGVGLLVIAR